MTSIQWTNDKAKLSDLTGWERNPRYSTEAQAQRIAQSYELFSQVETIAVDAKNTIINGHQRLNSWLAEYGPDLEVDIRKADRTLDEGERQAITAMLHAGAVGSWDFDALANWGWDSDELASFGFDEDLAKSWHEDAFALEGLLVSEDDSPQEAPEPVTQTEAEKHQEVWKVKPSDVWQLGRHKIACLDSLDEKIVLSLIDDAILKMIWSDPPYGIDIVAANGYVGGGEAYDIPFGGKKKSKRLGTVGGAKPFGSKEVRGTVGSANLVDVGKYAPVAGDSSIETAEKSASLLLELFPNAIQFWWGGNYYTSVLPPSSCWVIWDKDNTGNFADCEMAWSNHDGVARIFEHRWNGMLKASEQGERRVHPTQKPVALFEWCAGKYLKDGGLVFDPFLGSGISVIGAENLGENYTVIGCELAPEYIATTIQRWVDLTGKTPELLTD